VKVETREQSKQWMQYIPQTGRKSLNKQLLARKLMAAVSWDREEC
jgi:hypothetical protein